MRGWLALVVLLAGCSAAPTRPPALGVAWSPVDSLNADLPDGVRVLAGVSERDTLRAWAVVLDGVGLDVVVADSARATTAFVGDGCAAINAGYFDIATGRPVGLAVTDGVVRSPAFREVVRDGVAYPVARGAVGVAASGRAEIAWARDADGVACRLDRPLENRSGAPAAEPVPRGGGGRRLPAVARRRRRRGPGRCCSATDARS